MSRGSGRFRPRLVPALLTILVALGCTGLGVWQLERLQWKRGLIAQREAALAAAPVAPPANLTEARALEFHPVVAAGVLLHDRESLLNATGPNGGAGFDVLTPLRLDDGGTVIIDRGFVPAELRDAFARQAGPQAGKVRIAGHLRLAPPQKPNWFVPDNRPEKNQWFWIDLPAIASAHGLGEIAPFYIAADATPNPAGWPKGGAGLPELPNDHLQYAITWFALALAAIVIYLLAERRGSGDEVGD